VLTNGPATMAEQICSIASNRRGHFRRGQGGQSKRRSAKFC
jgi:hypothetical protein